MKKNKRILLLLLIVSAIGVVSNYLVRTTPVSSFAIFDTANLETNSRVASNSGEDKKLFGIISAIVSA